MPTKDVVRNILVALVEAINDADDTDATLDFYTDEIMAAVSGDA